VTGGKPIAILQSISGVRPINPLVAFYDIHGGKREVLFFYFVPDTTRGFFLTGLISPLLPTLRVSCVARINSGIPQIDNEQ
jgi:hypothetical protein